MALKAKVIQTHKSIPLFNLQGAGRGDLENMEGKEMAFNVFVCRSETKQSNQVEDDKSICVQKLKVIFAQVFSKMARYEQTKIISSHKS